jgi:hypothetical protein
MADEYKLSEEEYQDYMELRNQRAMGDGELQIISKFKFEGRNIEEFVGKFRHVAEQFKVSKIFFDNYGRAAPMGMIKLLRNG